MTNERNAAYPNGLRTWIDGTLYADPAEARVPATDHGLVAGDGVFEVLRVTPKGPFAPTRHLARLQRSAQRLGLPEPDLDLIRRGIDEVSADRSDWELPEGRLRITYTGGLGPLGSHRTQHTPMVLISAEPCEMPAETDRIITLPWTRNVQGAMTWVKTTSYGENVRALAYARDRGCGEGIFVNTEGHVAEGTGANIFFVLDGVITTPTIDSGALDGITRALVLEWFDGIVERDVTLAEAQAAEEVFLTSSTRDVQGIAAWDHHEWPAPGPVARRLRPEFKRLAGLDLDP
ncbi:aminodeoxychorismate lyase [Ammonicoccus fulvus]|uniref:aminodeoxychorismate lyase n=1 Tax=Ammonicoccus fulvus TaxID=3138240 RepID=A0ABZ3FP62_9ACTN